MLLKEEFTANLSYLEPNINSMLYAGEGNLLDIHLGTLISIIKDLIIFPFRFNDK